MSSLSDCLSARCCIKFYTSGEKPSSGKKRTLYNRRRQGSTPFRLREKLSRKRRPRASLPVRNIRALSYLAAIRPHVDPKSYIEVNPGIAARLPALDNRPAPGPFLVSLFTLNSSLC